MAVDEMVTLFRGENLQHLLSSGKLKLVVLSFRHRLNAKQLLLGGSFPPSCDETNVLSQNYNPQSDCSCTGVYPVPPGATVESILQQTGCQAIKSMVNLAEFVSSREDEWNPRGLFMAEHLQDAMSELVLANADEQSHPDTCLGYLAPSVTKLQAPDRRPNPEYDTEASVYHQMYPTNEKVKICADAKYFFAIACAGGLCDEGLTRAVAEAANDILIADYCEAADPESLASLQGVGGAAMAFLKLCHFAGLINDWQFNNYVAQIIQFRVIGYYRDHSRARRPNGVYGSRMTGWLAHRYIDLAIYIGVMNASIGTGEQITQEQFTLVTEVCGLIGDLIDFRSDTMRKLRENVILRGIRGNLCSYLDNLISTCLQKSAKTIRSSGVSALVVMGISNWMLMSSQHKVYEVLHGVQKDSATCDYNSTSDGSYQQLLQALDKHGTLGDNGPSVTRRRADMDMLYHHYRNSPQIHMAWLADSTRSLLNPVTLRKIVDVVHFEWRGHIGDVEYCP